MRDLRPTQGRWILGVLLGWILAASPLALPSASAATSAPGDQLWASRYNGSGDGFDQARDLGVSPDGSTVFVTGVGSLEPFGGGDFATLAYDVGTGAPLWLKRYNGPGNWTDLANSLDVSPDGASVFVTGTSVGSADDYTTIAYNASTGAQAWVERYDGPSSGFDEATSIVVSPDGRTVFVTGDSVGSGTGDDYATLAYDSTSGIMLWLSRYDGPSSGTDRASSVVVSHDGSRVYVTGQSWGSGAKPDYATIAYDASSGTQLWVSRHKGPSNSTDIGYSVGVSPDGAMVFVTGQSNGGYATVAYSAATGRRLWLRRYSVQGDDVARSLEISPDGAAVFVTGSSRGAGTRLDYATIAYDAVAGAVLWVSRYDGGVTGDDEAFSLSVSPDSGAVFVTGSSLSANAGFDFATLRYDSLTGALLWVSRYNGPGTGDDQALSSGVAPDGTMVFATGQSLGGLTGYDFATVAYTA